MNIVSNCCLGGYAYKDIFNTHFASPFIWCWMNTADVITLIENFKNIDFHNYEIEPESQLKEGACFRLKVDNKITITYSHYQLKKGINGIEKDENRHMVYGSKIWEYVVEKYEERLKRMENENKEPVFLICDNRNGCGTFNKEQIEILSKSKYKVIFCSCYDYSSFNNENFHYINRNGNDIIQIKENFKDEIKNFILT